MMETNDKILDRVRKLLALAGNNPDEAEARAALAAAHRLMAAHGIEEAHLIARGEATEAAPVRGDEPLVYAGKLAAWKRRLAYHLATAHQCCTMIHTIRREGRQAAASIDVVGRASDIATVRYLFAYCERMVDQLAARHAGRGSTWLNSYRHGVVDAFLLACQKGAAQAAPAGTALAVIDRRMEAAKGLLDEITGGTRARRMVCQIDHSARATGQRDGRTVPLASGPGLDAPSRQITRP